MLFKFMFPPSFLINKLMIKKGKWRPRATKEEASNYDHHHHHYNFMYGMEGVAEEKKGNTNTHR